MKLRDLAGAEARLSPPAGAAEITGLTADSRAVAPGYLFAALPGTKLDGTRFIPDALSRGAVALLVESGADIPAGAIAVRDDNPRRRLARMAATFFGAQPETVIAVTGTNGKTSIASFAMQMWEAMGNPAASLGTLGVTTREGSQDLGHTTPDPVALQKAVAELKGKGIEHLAMEASSHGLAQYRLDGVRLKAAGFTNISRDHLDYHPTFEDYFDAKMRLFEELLPPDGVAVVNMDGAHGAEAAARARAKGLEIIETGRAAAETGRNIVLLGADLDRAGQHLTLSFEGNEIAVDLPLAGAFQAENALVAAGLLIAAGELPAAVFDALGRLKGAPGRLEHVADTPNGAAVYVDYAHTPDALETVLKALRPHTDGRLHCVFGCGGDRDTGKRPEMGAIAARLADIAIVTDDNPRSEDPAAIRAQILAAAPGAREIGDRAEAIEVAVAALRPGDLLLVAGKGHETGQIVGDKVFPFSDQDAVRTAVARLEGRA